LRAQRPRKRLALRDSRVRDCLPRFMLEQGEQMMRMHKSAALLGAAACSILISGCQKSGAAGADPEAVKAAIKADEKAWNDQFKANDTEALVGHYADDAYLVAAGKAAEGSTAIRKAYAGLHSDKNFSITFASDKVDVAASGDLAYARGHFSEKFTDPKTGKAMSDSGSYLTVYRKQDDGSWKSVEDFVVGDPDTLKALPPEKPATRAKMISF
jgi:uncharacterized protein (TIGR02246 family)